MSNIGKITISDSLDWSWGDPEIHISQIQEALASTKPAYTTNDDVTKAIKEYDSQRMFSDEILAELLNDKIDEKIQQINEDCKKRLKKMKIDTINHFTKSINQVIFTKKNETIVLWKDGTKTRVVCQEGDEFDREKGFALCVIKYLFGNISEFNNIFKAFDFDTNESQVKPNIK